MRECGDSLLSSRASAASRGIRTSPSSRAQSRDLHSTVAAPRFHAEHAEKRLTRRTALGVEIAARALTDMAAETPIVPELASAYPRLRGGTALVSAPLFAAPRFA